MPDQKIKISEGDKTDIHNNVIDTKSSINGENIKKATSKTTINTQHKTKTINTHDKTRRMTTNISNVSKWHLKIIQSDTSYSNIFKIFENKWVMVKKDDISGEILALVYDGNIYSSSLSGVNNKEEINKEIDKKNKQKEAVQTETQNLKTSHVNVLTEKTDTNYLNIEDWHLKIIRSNDTFNPRSFKFVNEKWIKLTNGDISGEILAMVYGNIN